MDTQKSYTDSSVVPPKELELWRSNVVSKTFVITALVALPLIILWAILYGLQSSFPRITLIYSAIYAVIAILAVVEKPSSRSKAWVLVSLIYLTGTTALVLGGLAGDGRVYIMMVPIIAMLLINFKASIVFFVLSILTYSVISLMAHFGHLEKLIIIQDNTLDLNTWIQEGLVVIASLVMILNLQKRHSELLISLAKEKGELLRRARESENRYRFVSELVSDLAYVLKVEADGEISIEWATDSFSKFISTPLTTAEQLANIIHPEDLDITTKYQELLASGEPFTDEVRLLGLNEEISWFRNFARPEWNQDRTRVVRIFGAMQNITKEKEAEEKLQRRNEEISRLYRASETLFSSKTLSPKRLAEKIVDAILNEFGQSNCSLLLIDQTSPAKRPVIQRIAVAGAYVNQLGTDILEITGRGLVPKAIRTGTIINEPDVSQNPNYIPNWREARSELAIPLKAGDSIIGAIDMQSTEIGAFTKDDVRLVSIFAERAASALEHARLNAQTQQRLEQIGALQHIDSAITGAFDLRPILRILLEETVTQLAVDAASVLLLDRHMQILQYADKRGFQSDALRYSKLKLGEGYAGKAALKRQIVHVKDIHEEESSFKNSSIFDKENFITYYGVPLIAKGEVKGVLEIFNRTPLDADSSWLSFLETLAGQAAIAIDNASMFEELQRSNAELLRAYDATLEGWVAALDMRDNETKDHTQRVTDTAVELAQKMGIAGEKLLHLKRGALLHDIGKMSVPDSILLKPGKLTPEEWKIMKMHPIHAKHFLSKIEYLKPALDIPCCHHEKWDGSGYPQGLKGHEIPIAARIFAIVDVWDALGSNRPYRQALPQDEIIAYIREEKGKHFDPEVVDTFMKLMSI